ncbi:MAG: hypothetical protein MJ071_09800 [Oscillospiraceae bacterium]|nr:hypothetical protein [Oscillospiraceae bacterium]
MKGRIVKIEKLDADSTNERIVFDIELEKLIDENEAMWYGLDYIGESEKGNSIISFAVFQTKNEDEDDDGGVILTFVPFQIAYAVSIHKAQGSEYHLVIWHIRTILSLRSLLQTMESALNRILLLEKVR